MKTYTVLVLLALSLITLQTTPPESNSTPGQCLAPVLAALRQLESSAQTVQTGFNAFYQQDINPADNKTALEDAVTSIAGTIHSMFEKGIIKTKPFLGKTYDMDTLEDIQFDLMQARYKSLNEKDPEKKKKFARQYLTLKRMQDKTESEQSLNIALYFLIENAYQHGWAKKYGNTVPVEIALIGQELVVRISSPHRKDAQMPKGFVNRPLTQDMEQINETYTSQYSTEGSATAFIADLFINETIPNGTFIFYTQSSTMLDGTTAKEANGTIYTYITVPVAELPESLSMQQRMQTIKSAFKNRAVAPDTLFESA